MKKVIVCMAAVAMMCMVSCNKEENNSNFSGSPEVSNAKTELDGLNFKWMEENEYGILVKSNNGAVAEEAWIETTDQRQIAWFGGNDIEGTSFEALYPAGTNTSFANGTVANMVYTDDHNNGMYGVMPMYGVSTFGDGNPRHLTFKNLCGVVRLRVHNNSYTKTGSVVFNGGMMDIAGAYCVNVADPANPIAQPTTTGTSNILTVDGADFVNGVAEMDVVMPVGTYPAGYFQIGLKGETHTNQFAMDINRNTITLIDLTI